MHLNFTERRFYPGSCQLRTARSNSLLPTVLRTARDAESAILIWNIDEVA